MCKFERSMSDACANKYRNVDMCLTTIFLKHELAQQRFLHRTFEIQEASVVSKLLKRLTDILPLLSLLALIPGFLQKITCPGRDQAKDL
jgi:hypothetical protein